MIFIELLGAFLGERLSSVPAHKHSCTLWHFMLHERSLP